MNLSQEVLDKVLKRYKENHRRVATAWQNLAYSQLKAGNHVGALRSINNAVSIRKDIFGYHHPLLIVSYRSYDPFNLILYIFLAKSRSLTIPIWKESFIRINVPTLIIG